VTGDGHSDVVVGAFNGQARVAVIDVFNNVVRTPFLAFESGFNGGARVAVADLSGTGRNQIIVGAGAGRSADVRIYNVSATGQGTLARSITAFAGSTAGVWVTADTGRIIVGDGGGVPEVRIFNPSTGARIGSFYPYTAQQSPHGVRVALTDRNFDGVNEIVTAPGAGGAPFVRFWNLTTFQEYAALSYFAYQDTMTGGVFLGGSRRAV
jgi:hypothetical protein